LDKGPGGMAVIFAKGQEKICEKIISKRNNLKKRENPGGGSKLRNKLCIKNEVLHVYTERGQKKNL